MATMLDQHLGTVGGQGRTCTHADPRNYLDKRKGSLIVTMCKVCGKWIGNRPANERVSK